MKKHEKILEKIKFDKKSLIQFCNMNDSHNKYSQAKLDYMNEMINYINKLK